MLSVSDPESLLPLPVLTGFSIDLAGSPSRHTDYAVPGSCQISRPGLPALAIVGDAFDPSMRAFDLAQRLALPDREVAVNLLRSQL